MAFTDAILLERVLQNAASANGNGTPIDVKGKSSAVMQITGTFSAVVNFEASLDGVNWHAVLGQNLTTAAQATNATATGLWAFFVSGFKYLRARISDYVSGTVTVRCAASPAGLAPLLSATINATVDAVNIKDVTDTNTLAIDSNGAASVALTGRVVKDYTRTIDNATVLAGASSAIVMIDIPNGMNAISALVQGVGQFEASLYESNYTGGIPYKASDRVFTRTDSSPTNISLDFETGAKAAGVRIKNTAASDIILTVEVKPYFKG